LPVLGWWFLARESSAHGGGFWIRPMIVDLATGLLFVGLYVWEVVYVGLYSRVRVGLPPVPALVQTDLAWVVHCQFASHVFLSCVMLAASLVDLDEKTIPDTLSIPGTLVGLILAVLVPWSLLPADLWLVDGRGAAELLTCTSPSAWPAWLEAPQAWPVALALGCWTVWCGGILPRRWNTRHGWVTAVRVFFHRLRAERVTYLVGLMWLAGAILIATLAWIAPLPNWAALLSALVGVALGGGVIWIVRVVGKAALGREAMGFGDVMLLSMIGAFVGWQGSLVVFFMGPVLGLATGLVQWLVRGEHEIPYGPYLCLAALALICKWATIWDWTYSTFELGWLLAALLAVCFLLMGAVLWIYGALRNRFVG
jgi:prepilin signal peptidase PulO-like enzyme (type II secretory pathway)